MPFGLPKEKDTPENNRKMERCVSARKAEGESESSAVAICKSSIIGGGGTDDDDEMNAGGGNKKDKKQKQSEQMFVFPVSFAETEGVPTEIHVLPVGSWDHPAYGSFQITQADIDKFVENFNNGVRRDIPIKAGHDVDDEKPAIGWFKELIDRGEKGLYAVVDWTKRGKELLSDRAYKYFSPELFLSYEDPETGEKRENVLVGGALTNEPYFKELDAVVFNEPSIINQFNEQHDMDLETIKAKSVEELSDEEKQFLRDNKDSLDEESQTKFESVISEGSGDDTDESGDGDGAGDESDEKDESDDEKDEGGDDSDESGDDSGSGKVNASERYMKVKASEFKKYQQDAEAGRKAFRELDRKNVEEEVGKLVASESNPDGKILASQKDRITKFMEGLSFSKRSEFKEILKSFPNISIFNEEGSGDAPSNNVSAGTQIAQFAEQKMKENEGMNFREAMIAVQQENPQLADRAQREYRA